MFTNTEEVSLVVKEFSRFATQYNQYNSIQQNVASTLVSMLPCATYTHIVDIGCGSGEIYRNIMREKIHFNSFTALDFSLEMLNLHPSSKNVHKMNKNFNESETFSRLPHNRPGTVLLSSSALQWSSNLELTLCELSKCTNNAYFAIFTANTFKTLHKYAKIKSPIYSEIELKNTINKFYHAKYSTKHYTLAFENIREMLRYIKKSGVSGGEKKLNYKEIKNLIKEYPLSFLEFEVLFVEATSLTR